MNEIPPVELPARTANGDVALTLPAGIRLPALIERAGSRARRRALEFFTASLRNANTRAAYGHAVGRFLAWAEAQGLTLEGGRGPGSRQPLRGGPWPRSRPHQCQAAPGCREGVLQSPRQRRRAGH